MSQIKLKNVHYYKIYSKFKKALNFCFCSNIFVDNGLKNFVLGSLNAEFCYLPCYSEEYRTEKCLYCIEPTNHVIESSKFNFPCAEKIGK